MNSKIIGDISEAVVLAEFLRAGQNVLVPFGDRNRYDLVIESDGKFERIQVKTGRLRNGAVLFKGKSSTRSGGQRVEKGYHGQIEKFAVYCADNKKIYLVPVAICGRSGTVHLRITCAKNGMSKGIHAASDFEFRA